MSQGTELTYLFLTVALYSFLLAVATNGRSNGRSRPVRAHPASVTFKTLWFSCSGRCARCGVTGITCTGRRSRPGILAVDPRYVPMGSILDVEGLGRELCADTGGNVKGWRADAYTRHSHKWNDDHTRHGIRARVIRWGWGRRGR